MEICAIQGGGSTPNGKCHFPFPFFLNYCFIVFNYCFIVLFYQYMTDGMLSRKKHLIIKEKKDSDKMVHWLHADVNAKLLINTAWHYSKCLKLTLMLSNSDKGGGFELSSLWSIVTTASDLTAFWFTGFPGWSRSNNHRILGDTGISFLR